MRVREWYGWHFPELAKIVADNVQYAKAVKLMGSRTNAAELDFSGVRIGVNSCLLGASMTVFVQRLPMSWAMNTAAAVLSEGKGKEENVSPCGLSTCPT
jgi:hypothetical protein